MENIAPNTLFTGHQLVILPQCDSTNRIAQDLLIKNKATEGCVVITPCQTNGRGQRGNSWEAAANQNLTLSVVYKPSFLAIRQQFYLNICVSLATRDLVCSYLPAAAIKVKWPNDLYYGNKKLGGILIENSLRGQLLQHAVIGIGLNVNQVSFAQDQAISLAGVNGKKYPLEALVEQLLEKLEARYLQLKAGRMDLLRHEYLQHLYRYQENHFFRVGDKVISGCILGIDEDGKLGIQSADKIWYFGFQEVSYVI